MVLDCSGCCNYVYFLRPTSSVSLPKELDKSGQKQWGQRIGEYCKQTMDYYTKEWARPDKRSSQKYTYRKSFLVTFSLAKLGSKELENFQLVTGEFCSLGRLKTTLGF
jgi:hypothetical protein